MIDLSKGRRIGGGSINEAYRVPLDDGGTVFVKTRAGPAPGEFATEAAALRWLAEPGAVRVPDVIAVDHSQLVLEWIEPGTLSEAGAEELGRGLARLHAAGAPAFGAFREGGEELRIGPLAFDVTPCEEWPAFYAERLLRPLLAPAVEGGSLSGEAARDVERVCGRIGELAGPAEPPARVHGDLWSGNVMAGAGGAAWLIDPAAYGGHREVDLAMLRLFGAPSSRIFAAYEEEAPLAPGHEERLELWQLFPLLVHTVLFGGGYGRSAAEVARRLAG